MIRVSLIGAVTIAGLSSLASAQPATELVEGAGVKVGEGTVIHPIVGVESGIVHNVFFEASDETPRTSGILRIIGELAAGSLPSERLQSPVEQEPNTENFGDLAFRLEASAAYEEYLQTDDRIQAQRGLTLGILARGIVFPKQTWQFAFSDEFKRVNRPVNFEGQQGTDRDVNGLGLEVRYRPAGRTLSGSARYRNTIDYFEDDEQQFANRIQHTFGVEVGWKLFPVTRVFADASIGISGPLGSASTRPNSFPLRTHLGIATALTVKTSLNAKVGFAKGFYESGPDFTNITGGVQLSYRFSPQARVAAVYDYDFQDSINANFFRDHAIKLRFEQWWTRRLTVSAAAELRFRKYSGVIMEIAGSSADRNDVIFTVPIGLTYNLRNWIAITADYQFVTDQTDFVYTPQAGQPPDDPSFTRHVALLGVRAAY
jgi:opacity protein-like surface antigen